MSFPRYDYYKCSGQEWLGDIPGHWSIAKFRHNFRESAEKIDQEVVGPMLSVSGYRGIEVREYDDENQRRSDENLVGYRIVRKGQLVVNTMWLNYAGLGISDFEGHVSPAYRCYWVSRGLFHRYVHHLMRSERYVCGYTRLLTGIRPNSLQMSRDDLMEFPVLVPPLEEQIAIAEFLDRETEKIDRVIEEQRRLIELLKEKRQAVISHAVTEGIEPNAPMKSSGDDWARKLPAHWKLKPLRYVIKRIESGTSVNAYDEPAGKADYGVLKTSCVYSGAFDPLENKTVLHSEVDRLTCPLQTDSLIVSRMNTPDLVGATGLVRACPRNIYLPDRLWQVTIANASVEYVYWWSQSAIYRATIQAACSGTSSSMQNLSQDQYRAFVIPLPPTEEQRKICNFIVEKTTQSDQLISESTAAIDLLQERRAALISAAVTGKINVTTQVAKPVRSTWNTGFARQVLAAEALSQCNGPRMGRIKLQKLIHLCEYHAQLVEVRGTYSRRAAGPFSPQVMEDVREGLLQQRWFEEYKDGSRYAYRALEKVGEHKQYLPHWEDKQPRIDHVLNLLGGELTRKCEIVSTLYAAWNDLLIEGKNPTDAEIIHEASSAERWHESKEKIATEKWPEALEWMRANRLVPVGYGTHTIHQSDLFTGDRVP